MEGASFLGYLPEGAVAVGHLSQPGQFLPPWLEVWWQGDVSLGAGRCLDSLKWAEAKGLALNVVTCKEGGHLG